MSRVEFLRKFFDKRNMFFPQLELEALDKAITEYDAPRSNTTTQTVSVTVGAEDSFQYPLPYITDPYPHGISTALPATPTTTALPLTATTTALPVSYDTTAPDTTVNIPGDYVSPFPGVTYIHFS
jgi:hypothetical protein